ncbi:DUF2330 domain-containing protein [Candidatus Eisenbacteria bacterium]|uniref:DUF2330 domain-containing protein n=1 Tax=Eiseniibacteriota bacterium TaxID=2212470 RepID=A0ABV6YM87_UNCEI
MTGLAATCIVMLILQSGFCLTRADGGFVVPLTYHLYESDQRALVVFDEDQQKEELYVQAGFRGDITDFAWIIPVPSVPEVDTADADLFDEAERLTRPSYRHRGHDGGCACGNEIVTTPLGGQDGGVVVYGESTVGIYATRIVGADSSAVLADSLTAWGYLHGANYDEVVETLDFYVERDWVFVAMRVEEPDVDQPYPDYSYRGGTEPVHLSFDTVEPVYPMRISAMSADDISTVTVYVCADHRMTFPGADTRYANKINASELRAIREHYAHLGAILPEGCFLTKLRRQFTPDQMDSDILFVRADSDREFHEIHYSGFPPIEGLLALAIGVGIHLYWRRRIGDSE